MNKTIMALTVSAFVANSAFADQFDDYQRQNNAGAPMTVLTGEAAKLYKSEYNADDPGNIAFGAPKWSDRLGVAPFELELKAETHSGYMAFLTDDMGKVESIMWTHGEPVESWTTWELEAGQAADIGTTLVAFSSGFVEANPLAQGAAFPVVAAAKIAGSYYFKRKSLQKCQTFTMASGVGIGTAALNGITIAVGAFAPWALVPAAIVGYAASPGQNEAFWDCVTLFSSPKQDLVASVDPQPSFFLSE